MSASIGESIHLCQVLSEGIRKSDTGVIKFGEKIFTTEEEDTEDTEKNSEAFR